VGRRLRAVGITTNTGQIAALAAEDLPSSVVAELLGYYIQTTDK
jgi:hypothetical protein